MANNAEKLLPVILFIGLFTGALLADSFEVGRKAYLDGDYRSAYRILKPLAESGNSDAQKMMGILYDYGQGVDTDPQKALEWYIRSAEQGDPAVQYQVGAKYFKGGDIDQNYAEAVRWWQLAADGGQTEAQFNLGLMYFRGVAVEQDDAKAADLFRQAANREHAHAQYSLGVMYAYGRGVDRDYTEARRWFEKAAGKGIAQAQFNLGIFYEHGYGVEPDMMLAQQWYQRAAAQGLAEAKNRLDLLTTELSDMPVPAPVDTIAEDQAVSADISGYHISEISPFRIKREDWILQQSDKNYTIQIASVIREDELLRFLNRHGLKEDSAYMEAVIDGVTRYNAFYGVYTTYADAQQAIAGLPQEISRSSPWVRNFGILQKMIN